MKTVLITNLCSAFDENLALAFVREGFHVYAMGEKALEGVTLLPQDGAAAAAAVEAGDGKIDYYLDTTDVRSDKDIFTVRDGLNTDLIEDIYRKNTLRSMKLLEDFLPLLDKGEGKRLFYMTSKGSAVNETRDTFHFGYNMSKAALHQFLQMIRNKLAPAGYTFRVYDPMHSEMSPISAAEGAYNYITRRRGTENNDPLRDDEDNLVFRDAEGRQHAW